MCTVTFVPLKNNKYILTQNRDEGFNRPHALQPEVYNQKDISLLYPKDPVGNGTWMASSNTGLTACLLNGAFEKHKRQLPYRKSRGLILLDLFQFTQVNDFIQKYDLDNIEPFTIIAIDNNIGGFEIAWDEKELHCSKFHLNEHQIWSSSTLYTPVQKAERHQWYNERIELGQMNNWNDVMQFHLQTDANTENTILMKREHVGTVSVTSVHNENEFTEMNYMDLQNNDQVKVTLSTAVLNK